MAKSPSKKAVISKPKAKSGATTARQPKRAPPAASSYVHRNLVDAINDASPVAINALFKPEKNTWLDSAHDFSNHDEMFAHLHACQKGASPKHRKVGEYLAASVIPHTLASSSYLSKCIYALLNGDCEIAIHLAYYSELRAAFAILARHGIGIMRHAHYVVDAGTKIHVTKEASGDNSIGTHPACWKALEAWAKTDNARDFLATNINFKGINLQTYMQQAAGSTAGKVTVAEEWITSWGIDLKDLANDQDIRNNASYQPSFNPALYCDTQYYTILYDTLKQIWELLFPPTFMQIDQHLILEALKTFYVNQGVKGTNVNLRIKDVFQRQGVQDQDIDNLLNSQIWTNLKELISKPDKPSKPIPVQMLMRAAILNRLAIGASQDLIGAAISYPETKPLIEQHLFEKLSLNYKDPDLLHLEVLQVFEDHPSVNQHPRTILKGDEVGTISNANSIAAWALLPVL